MITYDYEQLVDKVIAILQSKLPAEITAINADKSDSYVLTNPEGYYFGLRMVDGLMLKGKCVVSVIASSEDGEDFNPGLTEENGYLEIALHYWDEKSETAERKILRYGKALRNVLDTNALFKQLTEPANIKDSVVTNVDFGTLEYIGGTYMKSVAVRLRVKNTFSY